MIIATIINDSDKDDNNHNGGIDDSDNLIALM